MREGYWDDKHWQIYVLQDPHTLVIRYVGVTVRRLEDRLYSHISDTRRKTKAGDYLHIHYAANWIRSVTATGAKPRIRSVECGYGPTAQDRERYWIAKYRRVVGAQLTNYGPGGQGQAPREWTEEEKEAARDRVRRQWQDPAHRQRMSEVTAQRWVTDREKILADIRKACRSKRRSEILSWNKRGVRHHGAIVTDDIVRKIRQESDQARESGKFGAIIACQRRLAAQYGLSVDQTEKIAARGAWRHVRDLETK